MDDSGLRLHEWESEWEALEDDVRTDPAHALPELDRLVSRMLEESGYEVTDSLVGEDEECQVIAGYISAHDLAVAVELDPAELSPADVASALDGFRAAVDHLVAAHAAADAELGEAEAGEA